MCWFKLYCLTYWCINTPVFHQTSHCNFKSQLPIVLKNDNLKWTSCECYNYDDRIYNIHEYNQELSSSTCIRLTVSEVTCSCSSRTIIISLHTSYCQWNHLFIKSYKYVIVWKTLSSKCNSVWEHTWFDCNLWTTGTARHTSYDTPLDTKNTERRTWTKSSTRTHKHNVRI